MKLGCIADDFTGATDLANNLVRGGWSAVQTIGVPDGDAPPADAVVVALKSRTVPADVAVRESLAALAWLRSQGARQLYFKVCSTFDSTPAGNIGPVTEALMDALGADFAVATPAFPDNARTVFLGHLFVGDRLLNESGMQAHPLTPMTDPDLVRVMQAQCRRRVGLIDHRTVAHGAAAVRERIAALRGQGIGIAIADAVSNDDLLRLGAALHDLPLVTAGSGLAIGLVAHDRPAPGVDAARLPAARGHAAALAGSCSAATRRQVRRFAEHGGPSLALDPFRIAAGDDVVAEALDWAAARLGAVPLLLYSTADADAVRAVQQRLGAAHAGQLVEQALARIARGLVERGVGRLVVAGGETSGACVQALGIRQLRIGPQIDTGVPWCHAACEPAGPAGLHLALKSGNFGADDFFVRAFEVLG